VKAYVPATTAASGQITVGSRSFRIAAGTAYTGDPAGDRTDRTTVGQAMCVVSTLDPGGAIVEYLTRVMDTNITATASAYAPPSGSTAGIAILSYQSRYELRIPATLDGTIDVARNTYCFSSTVDTNGDMTASAVLTCPTGGVGAAAATTTPSVATASASPTASIATTPSASAVAPSSPTPTSGAPDQSLPLLVVVIALLAAAAALAAYLVRRSRAR
jgi:hypothetical protein